MQEITYTQTSYIRSCPMKYKFRYVDCLVAKKKDKTLLRGKVIHEAFEKLYKGTNMRDVLAYISGAYNDAISNASLEQREDFIIGKHIVYGMFKYYPFNDIGFEMVCPEEKFKVRIGNLYKVCLVGKVDGRVKRDGKWWLREVKTTGSSWTQAENRARVSYQGTGYIYGEQRALNIEIQGILYDFLKSSRLYKKIGDTAESYGERILGDYESHMTDPKTGGLLKESRMYRRYYSYRSIHQIVEYEKDIIKATKKIRDCRKKNDWMRNPDMCYFYNRECSYMKICWATHMDKQMVSAFYDVVEENPEIEVTTKSD